MTTEPPPPPASIDAPPPRHPGAAHVPQTRRLIGIDAARALAIVGMVVIHVGAIYGAQLREGVPVSLVTTVAYGKASTLFAFVAGLGITLGSRRGTFLANAARLLYRAAWLAPLGLFLGLLGTPVAVILQYYALWFVLAIPFLRAPTWVIAMVAAVGVVAGPTVLVVSEATNPELHAARGGDGLGGVLVDVVLTGYYPTVSWIWIVLVGMAVARLPLGERRVAAALTAAGSGVAVIAYAAADVLDRAIDLGAYEPWFSTIGHADTPLEVIGATGIAAGVTGACLLLADLAAPLLRPLAALGQLALTVYVGHIIVYAFARDAMLATDVADIVSTTLWVAGVGTLFALAWLSAFRRGPLEAADRAGYHHLVLPVVRSLETLASPRSRTGADR